MTGHIAAAATVAALLGAEIVDNPFASFPPAGVVQRRFRRGGAPARTSAGVVRRLGGIGVRNAAQ